MTLVAATDMDKLKELSARKYSDQAVYFLNSTWDTHGEKDAEKVWNFAISFAELDEKSGKEGCELDELCSHKFLERSGETLTVRELREVLREIDIDTNKKTSLSEFLIYRYTVDWIPYVNTIQGDQEAVNKAMAMLNAAQSRLAESQEKSSTARAAERAAREALAAAESAEAKAKASEASALEAEARSKAAAAQAQQAEAESRAAEARVRAATDEVVAAKLKVDAAVADLHAQQKAYDDKLATLTARGNDDSLGLVARNRARNELAQAKTEDPLPLQRAKITAEAEQRKHEKLSKAAFAEREKAAAATEAARIASEAATAEANAAEVAANKASSEARAAEAARQRSEQATANAVAARQEADQALEAAQAAFREAEAYLEEAKNTIPKGSLWWIDRELYEAKKYLPQSKGGIAKK